MPAPVPSTGPLTEHPARGTIFFTHSPLAGDISRWGLAVRRVCPGATMVWLFGLMQALGLSTASGLNAYVPLLVVGLLARFTTLVHLSSPYDLLSHAGVLGVLAL